MYQMSLDNEMIVDNFAGGGGASEGMEQAFGRPISLAINHDPEAIAMHMVNHPSTVHYCSDVWKVTPRDEVKGRKIGAAWFSPDCKHFSKAKGGQPVEKNIRGLAWVVMRWASLPEENKPRVIYLENVEEFLTWGPLINGQPDPNRKGETFRTFVNALKRHGYIVEWRELRACDYGAPTIRKRLFLIARSDGEAIVWPKPTHGDPSKPGFKASGLLPWRTAAECIDWSIAAPSIFSRPRPLAENTLKRVAKGFKRFVIEVEKPFIVPVCHGEAPGQDARIHDIDQPLPTVTAKGKHAVVTPFLTKFRSGAVGSSIHEPLPTITAGSYKKRPGGNGHALGVVTPFLVGAGGPIYAGKPYPVDKPLGAVTTENHRQMVMPFLAKHFGGVVGVPVDTPMPTITTSGSQIQLVTAYVNKLRGQNVGHAAEEPLHTVSAGGTHHAVTTAYMVKYYGKDQAPKLEEPLHTVTTKDRFAIVQAEIQQPTNLTDEQRYNAWWVARFLEDYGVIPERPANTPRPSLFMLGDWIVWDIGMRMMAPRELYRAQGFPETYIIDRTADGKPITRTAQVRMCGNSVCPVMAKVLSEANVAPPQLITTRTRLQA